MMRVFKNIVHRVNDYLDYFFFLLKYSNKRKRLIDEIRQRGSVRVAFIICNLPMWKNQELLDLLLRDKNFEVQIILSPNITYPIEQQKSDIEGLKKYFDDKGLSYIDYNFEGAKQYALRSAFNPDILFYQQSYDKITCPEYDYRNYLDKLIAYIPYSFWPGAEPYGFDLPFHRYAWVIFYANDLIMNYAKTVSLINARNSEIVGYPSTDLFNKKSYNCVWKSNETTTKRIIWAPHFTIKPRDWNTHSSFLEVADDMVRLAKDNIGKLEIIFKPHPKLKAELYDVWGKEKTDFYYRNWETMPNTQLESGEYVDLFMTSDCLVHDCGSFLVEYMYSNKPAIYLYQNPDSIRNTLNDLGVSAFDLHYKAHCMAELVHIINDVVIQGNDTMAKKRKDFLEEQLSVPNGGTVSGNIFTSICVKLGLS